jgi:hypothetical protein
MILVEHSSHTSIGDGAAAIPVNVPLGRSKQSTVVLLYSIHYIVGTYPSEPNFYFDGSGGTLMNSSTRTAANEGSYIRIGVVTMADATPSGSSVIIYKAPHAYGSGTCQLFVFSGGAIQSYGTSIDLAGSSGEQLHSYSFLRRGALVCGVTDTLFGAGMLPYSSEQILFYVQQATDLRASFFIGKGLQFSGNYGTKTSGSQPYLQAYCGMNVDGYSQRPPMAGLL